MTQVLYLKAETIFETAFAASVLSQPCFCRLVLGLLSFFCDLLHC